MTYICSHCQGDHVSVQCPVWPQFCTNCNEEHPFGTACYSTDWQGLDNVEEVSEVDARIAEEERQKRLRVSNQKNLKREKTYEWRRRNAERYREYQRDYMRRRRAKS